MAELKPPFLLLFLQKKKKHRSRGFFFWWLGQQLSHPFSLAFYLKVLDGVREFCLLMGNSPAQLAQPRGAVEAFDGASHPSMEFLLIFFVPKGVDSPIPVFFSFLFLIYIFLIFLNKKFN
jgi:hypothetical protein